MDYSDAGYGYALYKGKKEGNHLIWLNSKRLKIWKRKVSSFLGELQGIVWAL